MIQSPQAMFPEMVDYAVETGIRIQQAMEGQGPYPLSDEQRTILRALWHCKGRERALPLSDLRARLTVEHKHTVSGRRIKNFIRALVVDFKIRVCASRQAPYGYYLPTQHEEICDTSLIYEHEVEELTRRVVSLRGKTFAAEMLEQLRKKVETEKIA